MWADSARGPGLRQKCIVLLLELEDDLLLSTGLDGSISRLNPAHAV